MEVLFMLQDLELHDCDLVKRKVSEKEMKFSKLYLEMSGLKMLLESCNST